MINNKFNPDWFMEIQFHESNKINLICYPWGGGNASAFVPWRAITKKPFNIWALKMPGRENRMDRGYITSASELVENIIQVLPANSELPFVFYGHSMGAGLAFQTINELRRRELCLPQLFIASGRMPPHFPNKNVISHMNDSELINYLEMLSGGDEKIPQNKDFIDYYLQKIKADYILNSTIPSYKAIKLPVPILIVNGENDPIINNGSLDEWSQHSLFPLENYRYSGGHFFMKDHLLSFVQLIESKISTVLNHCT